MFWWMFQYFGRSRTCLQCGARLDPDWVRSWSYLLESGGMSSAITDTKPRRSWKFLGHRFVFVALPPNGRICGSTERRSPPVRTPFAALTADRRWRNVAGRVTRSGSHVKVRQADRDKVLHRAAVHNHLRTLFCNYNNYMYNLRFIASLHANDLKPTFWHSDAILNHFYGPNV